MGTPDQGRELEAASLRARRQTRKLLGLCVGCLDEAMPGHTRCAKHYEMHHQTSVRQRERDKVARGYRMERIPIV